MRPEQVAGVDVQIAALIWQHGATQGFFVGLATGFVLGVLVSWLVRWLFRR
jgi:NhaP-type Na+/H+ or K+/H+ antiporter